MPDPRSAGAPSWPAVALRLAIVAVPCWLTIPVLFSNVDVAIRALIAIVLAVTLINPADGLLLIAVVAPLAELLTPIIDSRNWRIAESTVLTFLAAWMLRSLTQRDRRGPRVPAPALAWLWAAAIVGSIGGLAWQLSRYPGELHATIDLIDHMYFFAVERIGVVAGARLLEGIGLAVGRGRAVSPRPAARGQRCRSRSPDRRPPPALSSVLLNVGHRIGRGAGAPSDARVSRQRTRRRRQRRRQLLRDDRLPRRGNGLARARRPAGALARAHRGQRHRPVAESDRGARSARPARRSIVAARVGGDWRGTRRAPVSRRWRR